MKYIIEFEDEPCMYEDGMKFYKCIQGPWWGLSERVIKQLTPYQPDIAPDTNVGNITNSCAHEKDHNADIGKKAEKEDCISRQAAIDALKETFNPSITKFVQAKLAIENLPSAQPEHKPGKWIGGDGSYICSECNSSPMDFIGTMGSSFDAYVETPMNFCPNCGADMRKGE